MDGVKEALKSCSVTEENVFETSVPGNHFCVILHHSYLLFFGVCVCIHLGETVLIIDIPKYLSFDYSHGNITCCSLTKISPSDRDSPLGSYELPMAARFLALSNTVRNLICVFIVCLP